MMSDDELEDLERYALNATQLPGGDARIAALDDIVYEDVPRLYAEIRRLRAEVRRLQAILRSGDYNP